MRYSRTPRGSNTGDRPSWNARKLTRKHRRRRRALVELDVLERQRHQVELRRGLEQARGALDRPRAELGALVHPVARAQRVLVRRELHDRRRGQRAQVVRHEQLRERRDQLRHRVVDALADARGQEREAFEQALDVRVAALLREQIGELRVGFGELAPELAEVGELRLVVQVEHRARSAAAARKRRLLYDELAAGPNARAHADQALPIGCEPRQDLELQRQRVLAPAPSAR